MVGISRKSAGHSAGISILDRPDAARAAAPGCVVVAGATGGIGRALCRQLLDDFPHVRLVRLARTPQDLPRLNAVTVDITCDITDESSIEGAVAHIPTDCAIDWVLVATGWLHGDGRSPEKTYRHLSTEHLQHAYLINAIGPALLLKHLIPHLNRRRPSRIGVLSARVGSISDNRLGGWHAYRASKSALNMLLKNIAIELARRHDDCAIVGLQPGTTDTRLSKPFQRNVPADQLQTPAYTARQLVRVMRALRAEDSGGLFDVLGLPFEP